MTLARREAVLVSARALESARALFRARLVPECHAYMAVALRALLRGWASPDANESPTEDSESRLVEAQALVALERAGYRRLEQLRAALEKTAGVAAPPVAVVSSQAVRGGDFEATWAEVERLVRFTRRRWRTAQEKKRLRIVSGIALGVVLSIAAVFAARLWLRPRVIASAVYNWEYPASYALDGLEATEWLLPDGTAGWLDILFASPRAVKQVRVFNVHNRYYADRASQRVRVTAFDPWRALGSVEGQFDKIKQERSVLELTLRAEGVTRVRVEVLSSFGLGGGIAEVEVH